MGRYLAKSGRAYQNGRVFRNVRTSGAYLGILLRGPSANGLNEREHMNKAIVGIFCTPRLQRAQFVADVLLYPYSPNSNLGASKSYAYTSRSLE